MRSARSGKATGITLTETRPEPRSADSPSDNKDRRHGVISRLVAYGLPVVVVMVAVLDVHVWPATGWRLFSGIRQGTQVTWIVETADADGNVQRYDPASAGTDRHGWRRALDHASGDPAQQRVLCEMWLADASEHSSAVETVTVRRARVEVPRTDGAAAAVVWDQVVTSCSR